VVAFANGSTVGAGADIFGRIAEIGSALRPGAAKVRNTADVLWLVIVAGVCEAAGLGLAAHGFRRTWREFGTGEKFSVVVWQPIADRLRHGRDWTGRTIRKVFRRPPQPGTIQAEGASSRKRMMAWQVREGFGPMPPLERPDDFVEALQQRLQRVYDVAQQAQATATVEREDREKAVSQVRSEFNDRLGEVEQLSRTVAVGGLAEQVYGWSLVVVGVVLGTVANAFQALP
jgi:hypothetical protein